MFAWPWKTAPMRGRAGWRLSVIYFFWLLTGVLVLWTHYFGLFILVAGVIWGMFVYGRIYLCMNSYNLKGKQRILSTRARSFALVFLLTCFIWALSFFPLLFQLTDRLETGFGFSWIWGLYRITWKTPIEVLSNLLSAPRIIVGVPFLQGLAVIGFLVLLAAHYKTAAGWMRRGWISRLLLNRSVPLVVVFTLLALPIVVSLWKVIILGGIRYLTIAVPALCLAAGQGVDYWLRGGRRQRWAAFVALLPLLVFQITYLFIYYSEREPPLWREGMAYVTEQRQSGDALIAVPALSKPVCDFYNQSKMPTYYFEDFMATLPPPPRVWIVTTEPPYVWVEHGLHAAGWRLVDAMEEKSPRHGAMIRATCMEWASSDMSAPAGMMIPPGTILEKAFSLHDYVYAPYGKVSIAPDSRHRAEISAAGAVKLLPQAGDVTFHIEDRGTLQRLTVKVHIGNRIGNAPVIDTNNRIERSEPLNPFLNGLAAGESVESVRNLVFAGIKNSDFLHAGIGAASVHANPRAGGLRIRAATHIRSATGDEAVSIAHDGLIAELKKDGSYRLRVESRLSQPYYVTFQHTAHLVVAPATPISMQSPAIFPVAEMPAAQIDYASDTLTLLVKPGQGNLLIFPPIETEESVTISANYLASRSNGVQIAVLGFNSRDGAVEGMSGEFGYFLLSGYGLAPNQTKIMTTNYRAPDGYVLPAVQVVNSGNAEATVCISDMRVIFAPPLPDLALNPNRKVSLTPDGHLSVLDLITQKKYTVAPEGIVHEAVTGFRLLNDAGTTNGHVRASIHNRALAVRGAGSVSLKAIGSDNADKANVCLIGDAERGTFVTEAAVQRRNGEEGMFALVTASVDGYCNSGLHIRTDRIPLDDWHVVECSGIMPRNQTVWVVAQVAGGETEILVDDVCLRQVGDEEGQFDVRLADWK
ncbi:MAG: hypothetical protein C4527_24265 [Candidatus Omnitrophota bacterium]|jgi:hypothetical protein|nr:MAG: hypothetical protein C4527_24265 [Candidatus Omnitrophota bacterium]